MKRATFKQFLSEASQGKQKWEKYFAGLDVDTVAKSDSQLFDAFGKALAKTIDKGDSVRVLASDTYSPKLRVRIGDGEYLMRLDDLEKPSRLDRTVGIELKPDQLGLTGDMKLASYAKTVKADLDKVSELPEVQAGYLKALVDLAEKPDDQGRIEAAQDAYIVAEIGDDSSLKNTINNDFMEVLGPLFVLNERSEFKGGSCFFPEAGNEPLYDFKMTTSDGEESSFSSKRSGGNTNTLKVSEALKLAKAADAKTRRRYAREIELMDIIQESSVKTAPDRINEWLSKNFKAYKKAPPAGTDSRAIAALEASTVRFINDHTDLEFTPLVQMAIPDLWYVKARLNSDGTIKVEPLKAGRDIDGVKFRSKSSPGHLSDKIGFAM